MYSKTFDILVGFIRLFNTLVLLSAHSSDKNLTLVVFRRATGQFMGDLHHSNSLISPTAFPAMPFMEP